MDTKATVVRVDGKLVGAVTRSEACAKCGACEHGRKEVTYYPLPAGTWKEGDTVLISLKDSNALGASFLAYGIPLVTLIIGIAVPTALGCSEGLQAAGALIGVIIGGVLLKILNPRFQKSGRYTPVCTAMNNEEKP